MRRSLLPVLALAVLIVGVVDAGARSTATHSVTVEILGKGTVKSSPSGISCGGGNTKCYSVFSEGTDVQLTAKAAGGWTLEGCDPSCDAGSSGDSVVTATFNPSYGTR